LYWSNVSPEGVLTLRTFFLFLLAGGITATIYFALLAVSLEILRFDYRVGVSIAYVTAISFHFFANRKLTFRAIHENPMRQVIRYFPMVALNSLLTVAIFTVSVEMLGLSPYLGAVMAIVVTTGLSFFISKAWVFRKGSIGG
jgi:putative flippase GtrA